MAETKQNIYMKLSTIQTELNVPKNAFNKFGNYNYRNCESILEAIKPFLKKHKVVLVVTDSVELIGERFYIKATAKIIDSETGESIENSAFAREPLDVKGMNPAQITGASSSYARKYALGGLLALDDNKDPDTDEYTETQNNAPAEKKATKKETAKKDAELPGMNPPEENVDTRMLVAADNVMSKEQYDFLLEEIKRTDSMDDVVKYAKTKDLSQITSSKCVALLTGLAKRPTKTA